MRKRFLSLLLVLACVLTLAVVPVIAAEPDPVQPSATHDGACSAPATEPTAPRTSTEREPSPEPSAGAYTDWPVVSGGDGLCLCARHPAR
ncbi:MAG: hypothetical protein ACLUNO_09800 [Oscillospiraceae bacterium]